MATQFSLDIQLDKSGCNAWKIKVSNIFEYITDYRKTWADCVNTVCKKELVYGIEE
jgi:hypothetical protein